MIKLSAITKEYKQGNHSFKALSDINLEIQKGELVFIVGPSGSGKSTLLYIIGLLIDYTGGVYHLNGTDVSDLSSKQKANYRLTKIGLVFQSFYLLNYLSALENVCLPLGYKGYGRKERQRIGLQMLEQVGLATKRNNKPFELSGGEQQRVAIARALAGNPELVLADEPTGNLDSKTAKDIIDLLRKFNDVGKTVIIVTHNENLIPENAKVIQLLDGHIVNV
jgi:putative ABC transport system ATP-binding protein